MLHVNTLTEIQNNVNTGVEYEIALFYKLLEIKPEEQQQVWNALIQRNDAAKIQNIIGYTNTALIGNELHSRSLELVDVSFETQNDTVGPSDIVMYVKDIHGVERPLGLSVKYNNRNLFNPTARHFITDIQIKSLRELQTQYTDDYIREMNETYGGVNNWFRQKKRSQANNAYIDLIRNEVITNWNNIDKENLLGTLMHIYSPIEFWIVAYKNNNYTIEDSPFTIPTDQISNVNINKYKNSYIGFYLGNVLFGKVQVKPNNGILESVYNDRGEYVHKADFIEQGVEMVYGDYFSSWDFTLI